MEVMRFLFSLEFLRMAVLWTLSLVFSYLNLNFAAVFRQSKAYSRLPLQPSSQPPICIVTGATSGLGAAAAKYLSKEGYYVILAGRSSDLLSKANEFLSVSPLYWKQTIQEIKQQQKTAHLKAFEVDLSSLQSMVKFRSSVEQWLVENKLLPSVQLLINNAGILATSCRLTEEGYDQMMWTNYVGAFTLTNLLLPLLKNSSMPSRIVNVTSFTHWCVLQLRFDEKTVFGKHLKHLSRRPIRYPFVHIYEHSKLFLLLFSYELHRQLFLMDPSRHISVMAADPGVVKTAIMREIPWNVSQIAFSVLRFLRLLQSPEEGIDSIVDAAFAPQEASGQYFFGGRGRTVKSSPLSNDAKLAKKLWATTSELLFQSGFKI